MPARFRNLAITLAALCSAHALANATDTFPPETSKLRASSLPGFAIAQQKCPICHSVDYIELQPPAMTKAQWTAEVAKMQRIYGAPIDEREIALLGEYLGATYGGGQSDSASTAVSRAR